MAQPSVILATASYDHTIKFWEAKSGRCHRTIQYPDSQVNRLEITPDKRFLAAAGNPHIRLFDVSSNSPQPVISYDSHTSNVMAVGFHCDGNWMYSGSEDGTVRIWDLRTGTCQREYESRAAVNTVVLHPNQKELISGDQNGNIRVWDLSANSCSCELLSQGADKWVSEFSSQHNQGVLNENWVDEFSKLNVTDEWAEEFSGGGFGESSADPWVDEFQEHLSSFEQSSGTSRGVYVFSENNPYVGHPNPMQEGQELFRKGLLSEAVLALEAEVLKNPDNAEGWRLLGVTHAENDDDQQAIAAMMRALEANPTNLEVLLALGVSHTNELEQGEALRYLHRWLQNHPKYGGLVPPQSTDSHYGPDVVRLFNEAAQMSPEDADVHIVLGVLYNLSREYDKAIASFKTALQLKPQDYSLWNKLGATQANSIQSADAILAYQQALDLKPNYVRAWANMGISYANQGLYEDSIRYYVRAVAMNPKADNAWQYLRISLSNASRADMVAACDARNLDALQKEFPL